MAYCGWAYNVNKWILDVTKVTVGDGASVTDEIESGGLKKRRVTCSNPPDKYSVTMEFDFAEKQSNGYTELENFWAWYKTVHKFGTVPFEFPAILINSNRQQGYAQDDLAHIQERIAHHLPIPEDEIPRTEYYCITSALEGSKSGNSLQITMTWETYATGTVQVPDEAHEIDHVEAYNGQAQVFLTTPPAVYIPDASTWPVTYESSTGDYGTLSITGCIFDGNVTAVLFFDKFQTPATYTVSVNGIAAAPFVVRSE